MEGPTALIEDALRWKTRGASASSAHRPSPRCTYLGLCRVVHFSMSSQSRSKSRESVVGWSGRVASTFSFSSRRVMRHLRVVTKPGGPYRFSFFNGLEYRHSYKSNVHTQTHRSVQHTTQSTRRSTRHQRCVHTRIPLLPDLRLVERIESAATGRQSTAEHAQQRNKRSMMKASR